MNLFRKESVQQEYISRDLFLDKTTMARSIKKLESEGYIIRKKDEHDGRAYNACLACKGDKDEQ